MCFGFPAAHIQPHFTEQCRSYHHIDSVDACEANRWHTFRHTYRSWLDETGAPMKVQQELMRHASIQTTMNVYGRAMTDSKRKANSQVVGLVFGETLESRREALSRTALQ